MTSLISWFSTNAAGFGILGAAIAFVWSTTQQIVQRRAEAREREFEAFHRLVRELVSPDSLQGVMWIDRQAAVVFELRHFHRYYDFTERMLAGLRSKWTRDPNSQWPRLIEEVDLTLKYIESRR